MSDNLLEFLYDETDKVAIEAKQRGLLAVKVIMYRKAALLTALAQPLLYSVVLVSFVHLFQQLALIEPAGVQALVLPDLLYHVSAAAFTVVIDLVALYVISASHVYEYADEATGITGIKSFLLRAIPVLGRWFFYTLTAILNATFVFSYMPELPSGFADSLPILRGVSAVLLALLVPTAISAVEGGRRLATRTKLKLLIHITILADTLGVEVPINRKWRLVSWLAQKAQALNVEAEAAQTGGEQRNDVKQPSVPAKPVASPEPVQPATGALAAPDIENHHISITIPPAPTTNCVACGKVMTTKDKAVAGRKRWKELFGGYACEECRSKV